MLSAAIAETRGRNQAPVFPMKTQRRRRSDIGIAPVLQATYRQYQSHWSQIMKLEKCPYCGSFNLKPNINNAGRRCSAYVQCCDCEAEGPFAGFFDTAEEAIEAAARLWNTRVPAEPAKEELASDEITPEWLEAEGWNGNNNTWTRDGVRIEVNSLSHGCWSASVEGVHLCYLRSIHDLLRLVAAIRG
jgi:hypothetical protein